MVSRRLKRNETYSFQIAFFMCEAAYRSKDIVSEHGDIEVKVRAGDNYYCRFLCHSTLTIDEIKVYIAKMIRAELSHNMEIVCDYIAYWSDPNVPTT